MQIPGLPTLPTDSYYKFRALAGIWLIVGAIVGVGLAFFKFAHDLHDFEMRDAILEVETDLLWQRTRESTEHWSELARKTSRDLDDIDPKELTPEQEARFLESERRGKERLEVLRKKGQEFGDFYAAYRKEQLKVSVSRRYMQVAGIGLIVLSLVAVAVSIWGFRIARAGFREWHDLQRAQDAFLLRQWATPPPSASEPSSSAPQA